MVVSSIFLISAILLFAVGGTHGHIKRGRHQELAQRARGDVNLHERAFDNSRFTFYDVGLGACGQYNSPGDFIVALNVAQFGDGFPGPQCFKSITISYGGKTTQATIMDKCMGCPYGGLDFSTGLFDYFASPDDGVLYGSWWYNDDPSELSPSTGFGWSPTPIADWSTPSPTPIADWSTLTPMPNLDWATPTPTHHHHHAADTSSTTSSTESSTTSPTETSTTSPTETSTTSETTSSTPSPTETSTTATYASLPTAITIITDIPLPTDVIIIPVPVPAPNAAHPENLEVLTNALINIGMLVSGQRGNY
ncbi:hypothetical protein EDD22DRAFT_816271 [Suillus occidentalis]|nr:hypothetical protein EDD22DRAFT_816271 [Suillus occidentalis]